MCSIRITAANRTNNRSNEENLRKTEVLRGSTHYKRNCLQAEINDAETKIFKKIKNLYCAILLSK